MYTYERKKKGPDTEQLGRTELIEYTGGSEPAAKNVLPLLEKLAMVEETVIRQAAVTSFAKLIAKLKVDHVKTYGFPIQSRLAEASWFTSRCSAAALTPGLYKVLPLEEDKKSLLECHKRLCNDEMPMVKSEAYKNLVPLIDEMKSPALVIAEKLEEEKSQDVIPGYVKMAVEDDSWRVRKHIAENLADICSHLKPAKVSEEIGPLYIKLLGDSEPQVRKAAISVLEGITKASDGQNFAQKMMSGTLQTLVSDSVAEVRETLAEQVACLGDYLGKEGVKEKLLPVLKKLASDESPVARLNLCSKLGNVCKLLGLELFESDILPLLKEVTIDQRWRVRNSIVVNIAQIGVIMGKDKFAKSRLKEILIQSLRDPAYTVRETASKQVQSLNQSFGFDWMSENLFQPMKSLYKESGNYLHRMVPLKTVQLLSKDLSGAQIKSEFAAMLTSALNDPISNVRFIACKVLVDVLPRLDSTSIGQFKTALDKLAALFFYFITHVKREALVDDLNTCFFVQFFLRFFSSPPIKPKKKRRIFRNADGLEKKKVTLSAKVSCFPCQINDNHLSLHHITVKSVGKNIIGSLTKKGILLQNKKNFLKPALDNNLAKNAPITLLADSLHFRFGRCAYHPSSDNTSSDNAFPNNAFPNKNTYTYAYPSTDKGNRSPYTPTNNHSYKRSDMGTKYVKLMFDANLKKYKDTLQNIFIAASNVKSSDIVSVSCNRCWKKGGEGAKKRGKKPT
ncbi:protein phosphatase 2A scaffold subunit [Reticulomyxa filosa]|uniref:Protein phosphatase 2A scaffold subunit n=1 Tax=Reticulomyxa filosa TaxID=46433 RepID=X6P991_RETFI|nr:protein phosphatase 2A scaffold subunit [Reticulomyxa filosa]|eukprot:ETO34746.1 protein phosphatase 2A scaffold subunit [Reticulomyxa filosa]